MAMFPGPSPRALIFPVFLVLTGLAPVLLNPQSAWLMTSSHCFFNQLCKCKYAPDQDRPYQPETSTETTYQGQFGTITTR